MITSTTPYNPQFHYGIVLNFREAWKQGTGNDIGQIVSDEEIFFLWRDYYFVDLSNEVVKKYQEKWPWRLNATWPQQSVWAVMYLVLSELIAKREKDQ